MSESRRKEIEFGVDEGIGIITFNRPQVRNAMTRAMYERLGEICERVNADDSIRALILRGAGAEAFVSGTDISSFRDFSTPEHALEYEAQMDAVFDAIEDVRVPTIAALQGACTGGGAAIAASCDLRIGSPSARFGFPIARTLGNTLSMRNTARLVALVGAARAKELLFLARLLDASEMRAAGLLNEVVADEDALLPRAVELARTLATHAPLTLRTTKEAMKRLLRSAPLPDGKDLVLAAYLSEDFKEGVDSFLGKRKPNWKGR